jgi:hypothetical protein
MSELETEFLCDFATDIDWAGMVNVGETPQGTRGIVYVTGGTFEGPKIKWVVLPGGGDWFIMRPDGATVLDVRAAGRTDDGDTIDTYYRGVNVMSPEVRGQWLSGENIDPSEYYFRTTPVFETASEKYGRLNRTVAVVLGRFTPTGVAYKLYAIL